MCEPYAIFQQQQHQVEKWSNAATKIIQNLIKTLGKRCPIVAFILNEIQFAKLSQIPSEFKCRSKNHPKRFQHAMHMHMCMHMHMHMHMHVHGYGHGHGHVQCIGQPAPVGNRLLDIRRAMNSWTANSFVLQAGRRRRIAIAAGGERCFHARSILSTAGSPR